MEQENEKPQNEHNGISVYLWESEEWDCGVNYLDLIVSFSDSYHYSSNESASNSVRETKKIPISELERVLDSEENLSQYLLDLFGISNLRPGPGLPKGPFVHVDRDVLTDARRILGYGGRE